MPKRASKNTAMRNNYLKELKAHIYNEMHDHLVSPDNHCIKCKTNIPSNKYICENCIKDMRTSKHTNCLMCGRLSKKILCDYCMEFKKPFKKIYYIFPYENFARDTFIGYKENGNMLYGKALAQAMVDIYPSLDIPKVDLITYVPSHFIRPILRLCNPPKHFARALSASLDIPYQATLKRLSNKHANRKSGRHIRMKVAKENFAAKDIDLHGKSILLIDDVITTGATSHICSEQLKQLGADNVYVLSLCCVPSK